MIGFEWSFVKASKPFVSLFSSTTVIVSIHFFQPFSTLCPIFNPRKTLFNLPAGFIDMEHWPKITSVDMEMNDYVEAQKVILYVQHLQNYIWYQENHFCNTSIAPETINKINIQILRSFSSIPSKVRNVLWILWNCEMGNHPSSYSARFKFIVLDTVNILRLGHTQIKC